MNTVEWLTQPYFRTLPNDMAILLSGVVWGQKESLSAGTVELFRQTGLLHLLVLSGENITLLMSLFGFVPRVMGYRVQLLLVVCVGCFYIFTFPDQPSILRAAIMAIISSIVIILERQTMALYILFFSCAVMLVMRPEWLLSISFWLSCSATAGILILYPLLRNKNYILDQAGLFFSAQIFTAPLLLVWFREYPVLSLVTNMSVMWLIEPIMFFGILLSICGHASVLVSLPLGIILHGLLYLFTSLVGIGSRISSLLILRL